MHYYIDALKKFADFKGRSTLKEFWLFMLINVLVFLLLAIIEGDETVLTDLYTLIMIVPSLAIGARRMHDSGNTGWYQIIPIANIIYLLAPGTNGDNEYGKDPREVKVKKP